MWNTCSCHGEKRKSEILETDLYDNLIRWVASTTLKLQIWEYLMSHKVALLAFPVLLPLRRHSNDNGLVYLNWPVWDSKKNIPFGRKGGISLLMCWIVVSPGLAERLPSFHRLLLAVWTTHAPLTVTWVKLKSFLSHPISIWPMVAMQLPWMRREWRQPGSIFPGKSICSPRSSGGGLNPSVKLLCAITLGAKSVHFNK